MTGQRYPTSTTRITTLVTTSATNEVIKPEEMPDGDWLLEQYLVPFAGAAVTILAVKVNDSLVDWMVQLILLES